MNSPSSPHAPYGISASEISAAARRIAPFVHRTPVFTCRAIDEHIGTKIFFKCENLQKTGAFKFRGAINAVSQLTPEQLTLGVVTHSSGNHAAALASAARRFETTAHIVMPCDSSEVKKSAVREYGGQITECDPTLQSRLETAKHVQQATGATLIPPFDHPHIIAGQGTCALEFLDEVPDLDAMIAPIGGGGLMAGTSIACRSIKPELIVWGAEPAGADDAFRSKKAGKLMPQLDPRTVADGLRTSLGDWTWPLIRDQVDEIIVVDDRATIDAMRWFWERAKLIIEPSSAVPLAALIQKFQAIGSNESQPKRIGVIVSGGNVDFSNLPF